MAAIDADLMQDYAARGLFMVETTVAQLEIDNYGNGLGTAPAATLGELYLADYGGSSGGVASAAPVLQPDYKSQFISAEILEMRLNPFLDDEGVAITTGVDVITLVLKAPNGTTYNPTAVWDSDVNMWVAQLAPAEFQDGEWLLYGVSSIVDSLPQFVSLWWGDYMDDIPETRQAALGRWLIDGTTLRLYEDDGVTPFKEFDLKNEVGAPTVNFIYDKDPV